MQLIILMVDRMAMSIKQFVVHRHKGGRRGFFLVPRLPYEAGPRVGRWFSEEGLCLAKIFSVMISLVLVSR